jgi:hypothetical protein
MKAKDLLTSASKWTKDCWAVDRRGSPCMPASEDAVRWCLAGAIMRAYPDRATRDSASRAVWKAIGDRSWYSIKQWNDHPTRTFAEVRRILDIVDV